MAIIIDGEEKSLLCPYWIFTGISTVLFKIGYFRKGWVKKSIHRLLLAEYFADEITFAQVRNNTFTNIIWKKFKHI